MLKLNTLEDLKNALADALRPSDCPCATPYDRAQTLIKVREIREALIGVRSLGETKAE